MSARATASAPWGALRVDWRDGGDGLAIVGLALSAVPCDDRAGAPTEIDRLLDELLNGGAATWALDRCDWNRTPDFTRRVLGLLARRVPRGQTTTYAALAAWAGRPGAARAVGRAMARNPFPLLIPCHRCVASGGGLGGFQKNRPGGTALKARLLSWEGVAGFA